MSRGIVNAAVYLPAFRLAADEIVSAWGTNEGRGIERKAVPASDEDSVTMAIAAGKRLLNRTEMEHNAVSYLAFATTTPPVAEEQQTPRIARALALPETLRTSSYTQSTAGAGEALLAALDTDEPALVLIADQPEGELAGADHAFGAGAAAFLIGDDPMVEVINTSSNVREAPGIRYRRRGEQVVESLEITTYERNQIAAAVAGAVKGLAIEEDRLVAAVLPQPDGAMPGRLGRTMGFAPELVTSGTVVDRIGDTGAATVPIGLVTALEEAGHDEQILVAFYGSGGSTHTLLLKGGITADASTALENGSEINYQQYLRQRGYVVDGDVAGGGANVSVPTWQRTLDQRYRLIAGQCTTCGNLTFPPEGACPSCHTRGKYDSVELSMTGTIRAITVIGQGGAPPEFEEFQKRAGGFGNAIVELTGANGSVTVPGQITDADPASVSIGDGVEVVLRRLYVQEGLPRYGAKFVPTA